MGPLGHRWTLGRLVGASRQSLSLPSNAKAGQVQPYVLNPYPDCVHSGAQVLLVRLELPAIFPNLCFVKEINISLSAEYKEKRQAGDGDERQAEGDHPSLIKAPSCSSGLL